MSPTLLFDKKMADVSEETLKVLKKAVIDAFKSRYANISSTLKGSLKTFAEKAYANDLITEPVKGAAVQCSHDRYNKNFADIMDNFVSLLDLGKSVEEVLKHYQRFIEILEELGGPAAIAGRELSTELTTLAGMVYKYVLICILILLFSFFFLYRFFGCCTSI